MIILENTILYKVKTLNFSALIVFIILKQKII